ncbi:MAG: indole-3-glycerol phosphate synthase TrpC [Rhodothermaceae bacterium]|nr:indole-3-glycerol phosphate synthase TrpC [Rhodothermaceae bacterium]MXX96377.1 indole-3-glycerol phosphate synthase TrpC [Rhodothermaceae bacterium]MXZ57111.1 indole-3-glycerol phosphate synthase TrpC [Rhodothermaceae bacterium]MYB91961.1 indole-3-glycerol phosphate synthase TrpC [Rhodothermaceae bacterium]MYC05149.1 indole-3-glycerol phosphate synthase TrpC [Rhodothermaceae bacterium]
MTILDRIVTDVRTQLSARKRLISMRELESSIHAAPPAKDFQAALQAPGLSIIAEIKQCSPSKGLLRQSFDVPFLAQQYSSADAISVLTEEDHFSGSLSHLSTVAKHTHLPVLRKDFIIDPYQLYESRVAGADAVLLIAAILDRSLLRDLLSLAVELRLDCLVEIYDPVELDKIDFTQVSILGVNNRNLHTFEVDIEHSLRVFGMVDTDLIKVSESGLQSANDLAYLHQKEVDAVLIGETFMCADDPGTALRLLREETDALLNST